MKDNEFEIIIDAEHGGFGGFVPSYFRNTWPSYGKKNEASDMVNCDITDPNIISPGPTPTDLTNGSEAGSVSTTIVAILRTAVASGVTYAAGGAIVYKITPTTVVNTTYPLTIDKGTVTGEAATDLAHYNSDIYIFYNHSGNAGDIAKLELSTDVIDPDWGSTVPTGAAELYSAPHYCSHY